MAMVPLILGHCVKQLEELAENIDDMEWGLDLNRLTNEITNIKVRYDNYTTQLLDPARYLQ